MEKEGEKMKLGLGKIKEALRSGTAKDTGEGKKEQIGGRRQADKEETQKMVNSEKDSGSLEEVKMNLKRTEQEPQSGSLSPADRTKAEKTGLIFFPAFDWAISPTHPEREERLLYTRDQIFEEGIMDLPQIAEYAPALAGIHDIARLHFCVPKVEAQTTEAHLIAAGAAILLADNIVKGEIKNGFALVRPPGHHAMRVVHGNRGFCNINNEAIMVDYLRSRHGLRKIAIIDTDVHHGDGTQDIFWHDPDVLFISFHQDGRTLYPGTGYTYELGGPRAYARTINIPLQPGTTDESLLYVVDNLILPILKDFKPEFIVNSAGQDNHYSDPLG